MTAASIRAFLLDDDELVRRSSRELVADEDNLEVVGEAPTVAEAMSRIA